jgi:phosphoribosyl 1,2-cyclic phosphate phosphodiesterase
MKNRAIPILRPVGRGRSFTEEAKPRRAILTNMHSDLDYKKLRATLPPNVVPTYDGLRVAFDGTAR